MKMEDLPTPEWYEEMSDKAAKHGIILKNGMLNKLIIEMLLSKLDFYSLQLRAFKE